MTPRHPLSHPTPVRRPRSDRPHQRTSSVTRADAATAPRRQKRDISLSLLVVLSALAGGLFLAQVCVPLQTARTVVQPRFEGAINAPINIHIDQRSDVDVDAQVGPMPFT